MRKIKYLLATGLMIAAFCSAKAQTDTLTNPGRPFTDPKASDDNSKVLLDTSERTENMVDSLLEEKNSKKRSHQDKHMKSTMPTNKINKTPMDKTKVQKP